MSVSGTIVGLAVTALRQIKKIPRSFIYVLWSVPLFRFIFPISFGFEYSLVGFLKRLCNRIVFVPLSPDEIPYANFINVSTANYIAAASEYFPIEYATNYYKVIFDTFCIVWAVGALILAGLISFIYFRSKFELSGAVHLKGNMYLSDKVNSPTVLGIIRPRIIFSKPLSAQISDIIIKHETVHIRRLDNLWRVVAVFTCCVHWFNPMAWLFLKLFLEDMEVSADEAVLRKMNGCERKKYARALLEYADKKTVFFSEFGGAKTKLRIQRIMTYKRMTVISVICLAALTLAIIVVLITNPTL